jgi:hypothetical protein
MGVDAGRIRHVKLRGGRVCLPDVAATQRLDRVRSIRETFILESAFGTTNFADRTDKQGLGFALPHTCEVRAQPRWKHPFQSRPSVESVKSAVKTTAVFRFMDTPREGTRPTGRGSGLVRGQHLLRHVAFATCGRKTAARSARMPEGGARVEPHLEVGIAIGIGF